MCSYIIFCIHIGTLLGLNTSQPLSDYYNMLNEVAFVFPRKTCLVSMCVCWLSYLQGNIYMYVDDVCLCEWCVRGWVCVFVFACALYIARLCCCCCCCVLML